jgi:hypothetical protein
MVSGRGAHRPEEQPDPGVGANRQPAGSAGSRLRLAYLFGAVCPSQGKAAVLIMPVCNTAAITIISARSAARSPLIKTAPPRSYTPGQWVYGLSRRQIRTRLAQAAHLAGL